MKFAIYRRTPTRQTNLGQAAVEAALFAVIFMLALATAFRSLAWAFRKNSEWLASWDRYPFP